jgi:hypothetical protein
MERHRSIPSVCQSGMWDAGPEQMGGGTRSDWLGITRAPYTQRAAWAVRSGTKCRRVQILQRLSSLITAGEPGA